MLATQAKSAFGGARGSITIDGEAFEAELRGRLARMVFAAEAALVAAGYQVQNDARALCPVDTGRLRSSIMTHRGTDAVGRYVDIGTNVFYAPYVEYGTRFMAAQPFLRPAMARMAGMFPGLIGAAVRGGR